MCFHRTTRRKAAVALLAAAMYLAGCSSGARKEEAGRKEGKKPEMTDVFKVKFETTKGDFVVEVYKDWAPLGAQRFFQLVTTGFYDNSKFFRVLPGFVVQFGLAADPSLSQMMGASPIKDDPAKESNVKGTLTFATAGPNTRTTQMFVNLEDNQRLDGMGFTPVGKVVEGMSVVEGLYGGYGEGAPRGNGPDQGKIRSQGNAYLEASFPRLDGIKRTSIVE
jgi:peptidyl-prolyl cis-trans isomerase A (cyclophilin A)